MEIIKLDVQLLNKYHKDDCYFFISVCYYEFVYEN